MSSTKITQREAWSLSDKIADKAFEHLLEPWNKKEQELGKEVYAQIVEAIGGDKVVAAMAAYNVIEFTDQITIDVCDGTNDERINFKRDNLINTRWNRMRLINGNLYERAAEINKTQQSLRLKREALRKTLEVQMTGKSMKSIIKAWPEAESVLNAYFGQVTDSTLVAPLEVLLARFLPMLAAPMEA